MHFCMHSAHLSSKYLLNWDSDKCLKRFMLFQQPMAWIVTASEACSSVRCTVYSSQGEAAALGLGLPLPQVYFRLNTSQICIDSFHITTNMIVNASRVVLRFSCIIGIGNLPFDPPSLVIINIVTCKWKFRTSSNIFIEPQINKTNLKIKDWCRNGKNNLKTTNSPHLMEKY